MRSAAAGILAVAAIGLLVLATALFLARAEAPRGGPQPPAPPAAPGAAGTAVPAAAAPGEAATVPARRGAVLAGRVLSADDERPLASVRLEVAGSEVAATTDAAGAFRLEGIPMGPRALSVLPPEHVPLEVELEMAEGEEASRDLFVAAGAILEGRVLFEDKSVAGATVAFEEGSKSCSSGADGAYLLRGMPAGEHMLAVTAPGFLRQERWAEVEPGRARNVRDIEIVTAWTVRGVVRTEGKPVAGARVAEDWDLLVAEPFAGVLSAEDGTFTLRGADTPGSGSICAWKEGVGFGTSDRGALSEESVREGVVVEIPPPLPLIVRVIAEGDAAVEGAAVEAVAEEIAGVQPDSWLAACSSVGIRTVSGVTDSSGRVKLSLTPGKWRIVARKEGGSSYLQRTSVPREEEGDLDLRLYPGADIAGRVIDVEGRPVPGAWVSAWASAWASGAESSVHLTADGEGRFAFTGLLRVGHRVQADQAGFVTRTIEDVKPGATSVEVVLVRESRVRGTVVLADGVTPCRSFTIRLYLEAKDDGTPWEGSMWPFVEQAVSDGSGRFEVRGVEAGRIAVEAASGDLLSARAKDVRTEPGKDPPEVRLVLRTGAVLHGTVRGEGERPAEGADVALLVPAVGGLAEDSDSIPLRETKAGPDGTFEFRVVPAGKYLVRASADEHFPAEREASVAAGEDVSLDLLLPRGCPFTAAVVDAEGAAVPEGWITFLDESGEQGEVKVLDSGTYACFQVGETWWEGMRIPAGTYRVRFTAAGYAGAEVRFTAVEGEPVALKAVLKRE